jgi:flagellin-like hook-associated protein FlgL
MGIVINTNTSASFAQNYLTRADRSAKKTIEHIASGSRINNTQDDPAGMQIASQLQGQMNGLSTSIRNGMDALSVSQVAESAMIEQTEVLIRMYDLTLQAANGSNGVKERQALSEEIEELKLELTRIADTTNFGTQKLLNGYYGQQGFQIGANSFEHIYMEIKDATASAMGLRYREMNQPEITVIGSTKVVEENQIKTVPELTFEVNKKEYSIDLNYAMTAAELQAKVNNIEGLSYVEVDLMKGTGTTVAQEAMGLDSLYEYAPLRLRIDNFQQPAAFVTQDEVGQINLFFEFDHGVQHQVKVPIDPLVQDVDMLRARMQDKIQAEGIRGIEVLWSDTDQVLNFKYTASSQYPRPPKIDFEYIEHQTPGGVLPRPRFAVDLVNMDNALQTFSVINGQTTAVSGDFEFKVGEPMGSTAQVGWQAQQRISLEQSSDPTSLPNSNSLLLGVHVVDAADREVPGLPHKTVTLNGNLGGGFATQAGFVNRLESAFSRANFQDWIDSPLVHDVVTEFDSTAGSALIKVQFVDDYDEHGNYKEYYLETSITTISDDQEDLDLVIKIENINGADSVSGFKDTLTPIFQNNPPVVGHPPGTELAILKTSMNDCFGERAGSLNFAVNTLSTGDDTGRFHLALFDEDGQALIKVATATQDAINYTDGTAIASLLYNEAIAAPEFQNLMRDIGMDAVYDPAVGDQIDFFYRAQDAAAPTQLDIRLQYEMVQVATPVTPPVVPTFLDFSVNAGTDLEFQVNTIYRPEGLVGPVVSGDLYGGEQGQLMISMIDARQHEADFKAPEFVLNFDNARVVEAIETIDVRQPESGIETAIAYDPKVKLHSVEALTVMSLEATQEAIYSIQEAMLYIVKMRSELGAKQNRVLSTNTNNENIRVRVAESRSRIADLDYADASSQLAKYQVLQQTGTAMLTQANQVLQVALTLLQG